MRRRLAFLGLSANPPTGLGGHQGMVRALVRSEKFDEVWVLPVFFHMFAAKRHILAPFNDRIEMCRLCLEPESSFSTSVKVLSVEKEASIYYADTKGPDYRVGTIDIIDYLQKDYLPIESFQLTLVLGCDTFCDLVNGKWKSSQRLIEEVSFFIFSRGESTLDEAVGDGEKLQKLEGKVHYEHMPTTTTTTIQHAISSSFIRNVQLWDNDASSIDPFILHPAVAVYIRVNNLYSAAV